MHPYLFKTNDYGQTWTNLAAGLPKDVYLHVVREDPKRKGLLYAGTELGIAFSSDEGASSWKQLKLNFPTVAVHDLIVKENDLVVGTHGRSVWILDDLTPLREWSPQIAGADVHLFPTQPATRYRYHGGFHEKGIGDNPPAGAVVHYHLKSKPKGELKLEILDAQGRLVTTLKSKPGPAMPTDPKQQPEQVLPVLQISREDIEETDPDAPERKPKKTVLPAEVGVNRVVWDLRHEGAETIKRAKIDTGTPEVGPLVNPGSFTLRLTLDNKPFSTTLLVQPDARSTLAPALLDEQLKLALQLRDDITRLARMVQQIRAVRQQLTDRSQLLKGNPSAESLIKRAQELQGKLDALEAQLHNPKAEVTYDILAQRGGAKLYSQLGALFEFVKDGEGIPNQGMREVYAEQARELQQLGIRLNALLHDDLARLNEIAKILAVPNVIVAEPQEKTAGK
jgi:hypothetical protein